MKLRHVTVSPCKHQNYRWRVRWNEPPDGRERSRWYVEKADALAAARDQEVILRKAQAEATDLVGLSAEEALVVRRLRLWRAARPGEEGAAEVMEVVEKGIKAVTAPGADLTVQQICDERIEAAVRNAVEQRHLSDLRQVCRRFCEVYGQRCAADITAREIDEWLTAQDVGPRTRNHLRSRLGSVFAVAVRRGELLKNPAAQVATLNVPEGEPEILAVEDVHALLCAASSHLRPLLVLQAFCGLRRAEAMRLHWRHLHLHDAPPFVEVPGAASKVGRRRLGYMPPNAVAWLEPLQGEPDAPLFMEQSAYRRALEAAWEQAVGEKRPWPQNVLRHSFGTHHLSHFKDAAQTAALMGNSVHIVRRHYMGFVSPSTAAKYWRCWPEGIAAEDSAATEVEGHKAAGPAAAAIARLTPEQQRRLQDAAQAEGLSIEQCLERLVLDFIRPAPVGKPASATRVDHEGGVIVPFPGRPLAG